DFFIPSFRCPHHVKRVGVLGKGVCGMGRNAKQEKCVIYSFGINSKSSFEAALLERAQGCEVWGYDFHHGQRTSCDQWGPEITGDPELRDRAHLKPFALGGRTTTTTMTTPSTGSLMTGNLSSGHRFIEILKIDVDGGELDALTVFLGARSAEGNVRPVGQFQLEIHACEGREYFAR
ncbi:hypothetical protein EDB85DRAFT_1867979, partial [Lactarius pseudohatsudake]